MCKHMGELRLCCVFCSGAAPFSEAPMEGCFSSVSFTLNPTRCNLNPDTVNKIIRIKMNRDLVPEIPGVYIASTPHICVINKIYFVVCV